MRNNEILTYRLLAAGSFQDFQNLLTLLQIGDPEEMMATIEELKN